MIKITGLTFSYGDKRIFDNFSCEIPDRAIITGPSGVGKTTLLRLIAGLEPPYIGSIDGVPLKIALMFQEDRLLPWDSIHLNVSAVMPRRAASSEAAEMLKKVGLGDMLTALPRDLSGGQRRRVALAKALCFRGELMLLDEPFKGLDPALTMEMAALIRAQNTPYIAALHSEAEIEALGGEVIRIG